VGAIQIGSLSFWQDKSAFSIDIGLDKCLVSLHGKVSKELFTEGSPYGRACVN